VSCLRGCCASFGEHARSLTLSAGPSATARKESALSKDLDAYARLVRSGAQPKGIDGAAELERFATTKHEVEHRNIITDDKLRNRVTKLFEAAPAPSTTPLDS
jgi:hypothetical protein